MYAFLRELTRLQARYNVAIEGLFIGLEGASSMTVKIVGRNMTPPIRPEELFERTVPNNDSHWDRRFNDLTRAREMQSASNVGPSLEETQPEMHERRNYP